ncbi:cell division protein DedD [Candidatus Profftia sp. (ex Adelges kitamiensis)]|uniref:cell division protein DedD n=1 Tax=Candidatus Profftia sp. (ex Adelges kitamiensis) TaxID=2864218 RepID=UPI001CE28863|nr:cell division protein DedD [Candidatus Profftia sp. (ex Adelges kitamiensis)]
MTNKLQNQCISIVIIVLVIILLPSLVTGQKRSHKYYFSIIPLVPQPPSKSVLMNNMPPVTQILSEIPQKYKTPNDIRKKYNHVAILNNKSSHCIGKLNTKNIQQYCNHIAKLQLKVKQVKQHNITTQKKIITKIPKVKEIAPAGIAYIVQLGVLHNFDQANKIVRKLRLYDYHVYTNPNCPVQGDIIYVFVGPETSKKKLQYILPELHRISGLNGQVRIYNCNL